MENLTRILKFCLGISAIISVEMCLNMNFGILESDGPTFVSP